MGEREGRSGEKHRGEDWEYGVGEREGVREKRRRERWGEEERGGKRTRREGKI